MKSLRYLQLCVPFIHQPFEVESQVSGEIVQVFRGNVSVFQPLEVHHILLVMSHLRINMITFLIQFWQSGKQQLTKEKNTE